MTFRRQHVVNIKCFIYKMKVIKEKRLTLNTQKDSIPAKFLT